MNDGCPRTGAALRRRGFEVVEIPTDEFLKSGGSVKCLVLTLDSFA
jgi:N-dimethylarginine dimethylaminohydrolase